MATSCVTCQKTPPEVTLKNCSRCKSTLHCSRDCQAADWTQHKKICKKPTTEDSGSGSGSASAPAPTKALDKAIPDPFTRLQRRTWLHDRPETDVYRLLVDAYRMRVEDDYVLDHDTEIDSLYGMKPNVLRSFRRFLKLTASRPGLLPPWWDDAKQKACECLGLDKSQWSCLKFAVEKSDVQEHYGDPYFPMQLRMFAETVYQRGPGGASGEGMLEMMVGHEQGEEKYKYMSLLHMVPK